MKYGKKTVLLGMLVLLCVLSLGMVQTAQAKKPLYCTTDYYFVGHLGITDDDGRLLAWIGTVSGDINGEIYWYMFILDRTSTQVTHFANDRWYIFDSDDNLLLSGDEKGTTTVRHGKNSVWRSNGQVLYTNEEFEIWMGRSVHMGGHFTWQAPGWPDVGTGYIRIN